MDIESSLFVRAQVSRFGIGPLTSMYWYSETKKPRGDRLAPGGARFRRARNVVGQRRAALAAAQQSAAHHDFGVSRQQSARLRPHAARPGVRPLSRRRLLRQATEPLARAAAGTGRRGLGQGIDPALRDPDRRRDPRQRGRDVGAGRAGARRRRTAPQLQTLLARQRALSERARDHRRHPARARRPAGPAAPQGGAQVPGRVAGRAARRTSPSASSRSSWSRRRAEPSAPIS